MLSNEQLTNLGISSFESRSNAIKANTIIAQDCNITILGSGKDGMNAECLESITSFENESGYISLTNINYTCNVDGDGVQADTFVYINGGEFDIKTNATFVSKTSSNMLAYDLTNDDFRYKLSGSTYYKVDRDSMNSSGLYAMIQSSKGIKVGEIENDNDGDDIDDVTVSNGDYYILISQGNFVFNISDDAIHSNSGNITIKGGVYTIDTLDDAVTADNLLKIDAGTINVNKCYEGLEGSYVEINGGEINIIANDDGINAASDYTNVQEHIIITNGNIIVVSNGDGIDSNGSILISGGNVIVHGPTTGADAGLDADAGIIINGGIVFACSSLGMVETPATNSTAYILNYAQNTTISAGTVISVLDSNGNTLISVTTKHNCQSIILSMPEFAKGETYSIYGGSTKLSSFTINSQITQIGTTNSSRDPGGNPGGMPGGDPGRRW